MSATDWRIPAGRWPDEASTEDQVDLLAQLIADQVREAVPLPRGEHHLHIVSTTALSQVFHFRPALRERLMARIGALTGQRPDALLQAYLCTGWAFAIRAAAAHASGRPILITIADVDFHDLDHIREHPVIGEQGYGLTTLAFDLPTGGSPTCWVDGPFAHNGFRELVFALRNQQRQMGECSVFAPFLKSDLRRLIEISLPPDTLGPNLHASLGHCFGSDPWIGMIEALAVDTGMRGNSVLAGSFAYTGYIGFAAIELDVNMCSASRRIDPRSDRTHRDPRTLTEGITT
jgi:hypothetical protein